MNVLPQRDPFGVFCGLRPSGQAPCPVGIIIEGAEVVDLYRNKELVAGGDLRSTVSGLVASKPFPPADYQEDEFRHAGELSYGDEIRIEMLEGVFYLGGPDPPALKSAIGIEWSDGSVTSLPAGFALSDDPALTGTYSVEDPENPPDEIECSVQCSEARVFIAHPDYGTVEKGDQ